MMHTTTTYAIVESPDDDGYYAEFFDADTGKDVPIDGDDNYSPTFGTEKEARDWARDALVKLRLTGQA